MTEQPQVYTSITGLCHCGHGQMAHGIGTEIGDTHCRTCGGTVCGLYNPVTVPVPPLSGDEAADIVEAGLPGAQVGTPKGWPQDAKPFGTRDGGLGNSSKAIRLRAQSVQMGRETHPPDSVKQVLVRAIDPEAEPDQMHVLFWCDLRPAQHIRSALDPSKWSAAAGKPGVDCWVDSTQIVLRTAERAFWGAYIAERPLQMPGRKPTLIPGQGVILLQESGGHSAGSTWRLMYDRLDPRHAECQWGSGTIITDVPSTDVIANGLWWKFKPGEKYAAGNPD